MREGKVKEVGDKVRDAYDGVIRVVEMDTTFWKKTKSLLTMEANEDNGRGGCVSHALNVSIIAAMA
ncbi:hypothetical protein CsSME_00032245 [Camellia sinensis var. sinensis]